MYLYVSFVCIELYGSLCVKGYSKTVWDHNYYQILYYFIIIYLLLLINYFIITVRSESKIFVSGWKLKLPVENLAFLLLLMGPWEWKHMTFDAILIGQSWLNLHTLSPHVGLGPPVGDVFFSLFFLRGQVMYK